MCMINVEQESVARSDLGDLVVIKNQLFNVVAMFKCARSQTSDSVSAQVQMMNASAELKHVRFDAFDSRIGQSEVYDVREDCEE